MRASNPLLEMLRFGLVGIVNTVAGLGVTLTLQEGLGAPPLFANAGGYAVGWTVSYCLNRRFTFRSNGSHAAALPAFVVAAGMAYAVNAAVLLLCTQRWGVDARLAQVLAMGSYTVAFFLLAKFVVFRRPQL